jgi:hypothetical protein
MIRNSMIADEVGDGSLSEYEGSGGFLFFSFFVLINGNVADYVDLYIDTSFRLFVPFFVGAIYSF